MFYINFLFITQSLIEVTVLQAMLFKNFDKFSSVLHFFTLKLLLFSCRKSLLVFSAHILKLCVFLRNVREKHKTQIKNYHWWCTYEIVISCKVKTKKKIIQYTMIRAIQSYILQQYFILVHTQLWPQHKVHESFSTRKTNTLYDYMYITPKRRQLLESYGNAMAKTK